MNENPSMENLEFKFRSSESVEYLCQRNNILLFNSFLILDNKEHLFYIANPKEFYKNIDFFILKRVFYQSNVT